MCIVRTAQSARLVTLLLLALGTVLACTPGTAPERPNVALFVLDAARADHLGCYGYARDTTPHIDAFARRAIRYTAAFSEGSYTFASVAALLTGMPPARTGLLMPSPVEARHELLAGR